MIQTERLVRGLITFDLHVEQIAAAFDIPVENLEGSVVFAKHYRTVFGGDFSNVTILAADVGGANRARRFRNRLDKSIPICIIDKDHQPGPNNTEVLGFIGDPSGRDVLLIDDMIDTGGTLRNAIKATLERDARSVRSCATHGVLSGAAEAKFTEAGYEILTLNTIPRTAEYLARNRWLTQLPIDQILADAVFEASRIDGSVSKLFD